MTRKENIQQPLMPSPIQIPDEPSERDKFFAQFDFDDTIPYEKPPYFFEMDGIGFSPVGGIQALSGQKKNGKSIFATILIAAALCNGRESGRMAERFPGLRVRQSTMSTLDHDEPVILYVDTEQEKENTSVVLERAKWLAEIPKYQKVPNLYAQWLREMPDGYDLYDTRWEAVKYKINQIHPDLVILDGIRDVVHDFNDLKESSERINEMMNIASSNRLCFWCTLHMNPRPGNDDDSKMRGHLGTELGNKVSDTFVMKKQKTMPSDNASGRFKFVITQQDARGEDVPDIEIELNHDADGTIPNLGAPRMINVPGVSSNTSDSPNVDNLEDLRKWIKQAHDIYDWPMSRKDFKDKVLKKIGHITNNQRLQNDIESCISQGLLNESTLKKGGYYMIEPNENEMPF